jgi:hypothetical protein
LAQRAAVLAIAEALVIEHTLNVEQIISSSPARPNAARRADWLRVLANATDFAAEWNP